MSSSVFVYFFVFTCTLGLVYCTYSSTYGSSYKGVQSGGINYQQVPVPVYKPVPVPVYKPVPVPVSLTKGIGGYGFGGFPGSFGGLGGFGGGNSISSLIFLVIIISVLRGIF